MFGSKGKGMTRGGSQVGRFCEEILLMYIMQATVYRLNNDTMSIKYLQS